VNSATASTPGRAYFCSPSLVARNARVGGGGRRCELSGKWRGYRSAIRRGSASLASSRKGILYGTLSPASRLPQPPEEEKRASAGPTLLLVILSRRLVSVAGDDRICLRLSHKPLVPRRGPFRGE